MKFLRAMLANVTIEELKDWAGDTIYQRGKDYIDCVDQLSRTNDGALVARVSGTYDYVTWVCCEGEGDFLCDCTCPYDDGPCKHAVAVFLQAARILKKKNADIPLLAEEDDLFLEAFSEHSHDDWYEDEYDSVPVRGRDVGDLPKKTRTDLEKLLKDCSRGQLEELVLNLASDFPGIVAKIREKKQLESGQIAQLSKSLRQEIRKLTAEEAWYNHWKNYGRLPDYSHLEGQLRKLLQAGYPDVLLDLGEDLWQRGNEQVGDSNDDGMTAEAIGLCMEIICAAVPESSLPQVEQILWLVSRQLDDQYDLLGDISVLLNDSRYTKKDWGQACGVMEKWLEQAPVKDRDSFSQRFKRERIMTWLRDGYVRAGEVQKVIPLLEKEADTCQSYETLVKTLRACGEVERARQWCVRGYKKTIKGAPGIASALQIQLREIAATEQQHDLVMAYLVDDFLARPSLHSYICLRDAAEKIESWSQVREFMLTYLEAGQRPPMDDSRWPLPAPEVYHPVHERGRFPDDDTLIEIALFEKRYDDAVAIYNRRDKISRWNYQLDNNLAEQIAVSHPDLALRIWCAIAEGKLLMLNPKHTRLLPPIYGK